MLEKYRLHPAEAKAGRSLWNNLVIGYMVNPLDRSEGYKRLTLPEHTKRSCVFQYKDIAKITITPENTVTIDANTNKNLRTAESALKKLCSEERGFTLVDLP